MARADANGIVSLTSAWSFAETVERLAATFVDHGATLFATIDHQAAAMAAGLAMPPATVLVFGNPKIGTPLMLARPASALDLPSKVLVSEATPGTVAVSFNAASWLVRRHSLPDAFTGRLEPLEKLIEGAIAR